MFAALSLAARGGAEEAAEGPRLAGTENGLTVYEVESGGFSIAAPPGWDTVSADDLLDSDGLDVVTCAATVACASALSLEPRAGVIPTLHRGSEGLANGERG